MIVIEEVLDSKLLPQNKEKDTLDLEWYETTKTIIRRETRAGRDLAVRKNSRKPLEDGDLLYVDKDFYILVNILPCDCIIISPPKMRDMGIVCFEIGNLHLPIYIDPLDRVMVAYEAPLYNLLEKAGYNPKIEVQKLLKSYELRIVKGRINRL